MAEGHRQGTIRVRTANNQCASKYRDKALSIPNEICVWAAEQEIASHHVCDCFPLFFSLFFSPILYLQ